MRIRLSIAAIAAFGVGCAGGESAAFSVVTSELESPAGEASGEPFLSSTWDGATFGERVVVDDGNPARSGRAAHVPHVERTRIEVEG